MGIIEAASKKINDVDKAVSPFRQAAEKVKSALEGASPASPAPDKAKEKQMRQYDTRLAGERANIGAAMGPMVRVSDAIKKVP